MKKKIYFVLTEMIAVMALTCACSGGQKAEEPQESESSTQIEAAAAEPSKAAATEPSAPVADADADLVLTPDLNHNGIAEEIRLTEIDVGSGGRGQRLEIWENNELIYVEESSFSFTESKINRLFLCTLDGEDYLLRYHPMMFQGVYEYSLSTLTDNGENVVQSNSVNFDLNFGSPIHNGFDPEAIAAFMDEINDLLAHSVQLLNTDYYLQRTFEQEGQLYDGLWWLDDWEPLFVRDESKTLLENLEGFQTAITAFREPKVIEEVDGLPITEPLEMEFYSGAGAWRTEITLNPDGSFVGDYSDADCDTIYVCQFHGQFGKVGKITDSSWLLTLEELELDTGHSVGDKWDVTGGDYTTHYVSSEPYGFEGADGTAVIPGAHFILYSPNATGHEPGTELYGATEFLSWVHYGHRHEYESEDDILGCWGLQNMDTGQGFFADPDE